MANNLRKFATESEYNSATLNYPSVSWITGTDTVHFDKVSPIHYKLKLTYSDSSTYDIDCDTATTLTQSDVTGGTNPISAITNAIVGDCVSSIGSSAFLNCSGLTSIEIPNSVTSIGSNAFYNCRSLTSIDIPNTVTTIGSNAFSSCIGLTSIDIPSGVTSIGNYAFSWCNSLQNITIEALTPPSLGEYVFNNTNNCPIYVPAASVESYKAATNWSNYASRIQAIIE